MTIDERTIDDEALKRRHRTMWALGDYGAVAREVIPALGAQLVAAAGVRAGDRVLDVAAGTGNASLPAARAGARVTACDLTPELLDDGRERAVAEGLVIDWQEGDAEALPFGDGAFDVVLSCVGVMFAPHHRPAAEEIVRVCRPGGLVALLAWTPAGFVGQLFGTMRPYAPPPPPETQPAPLWGDPEYVAGLFADRVTDLRSRTGELDVDRFGSAEEFRDFFKTRYGPVVAAYRGLGDDAEQISRLDRELVDLARRHDRGDGRMQWEYLLTTGCR